MTDFELIFVYGVGNGFLVFVPGMSVISVRSRRKVPGWSSSSSQFGCCVCEEHPRAETSHSYCCIFVPGEYTEGSLMRGQEGEEASPEFLQILPVSLFPVVQLCILTTQLKYILATNTARCRALCPACTYLNMVGGYRES